MKFEEIFVDTPAAFSVEVEEILGDSSIAE
jgi:hypothetical protein